MPKKNNNLINIPRAFRSPMPKDVRPMLATLVDKVPEGPEWLFEIKWDGYRSLAFCNKKQINLISRNNKSFNDKFYPIRQALEQFNLQAILDGEIVVIKETGAASFGHLQNWRSEADGFLIYYVFDILWLNGFDLLKMPLDKRKELLKSVLPSSDVIQQSKEFRGSGAGLLKAAKKMGLEGIMAKNIHSLYLPGERSLEWLKIKVQNRQEVVIGGFTKNEGSPKPFSSLLVGVYDNDMLRYIGKIGTGFSVNIQKEMLKQFERLVIKQSPFVLEPDVNKASRFRPNPPHAKAIWLEPKLVCEVCYTEITQDGVMRHPSFEGMRIDKKAKEVNFEKTKKIKIHGNKNILEMRPLAQNERKSLLNPKEETQVKNIKGHELKFNHLSKIFWPNEGITKRDLINYYYQASSFILPYLKNRPQSLNRFPNGVNNISFYQKDVTKMAPQWIKQYPYHTSDGKDKNYLIVESEADLLWMANLGAIEMNPWNSTIIEPDYPTWCSIDIDPSPANSFEHVIETAIITRKILAALNIEGYCKTSGASGLHIYVPMGAKYTYVQCQLFARLIATQIHEALPKFTSIERLTQRREGKIYIDFLQNRPKATLAAPYSVRPQPGAPVSMPLHWEEVKKGLKPTNFTIKNAIQRIRTQGDLFKAVIGKGINLEKALKELNNA